MHTDLYTHTQWAVQGTIRLGSGPACLGSGGRREAAPNREFSYLAVGADIPSATASSTSLRYILHFLYPAATMMEQWRVHADINTLLYACGAWDRCEVRESQKAAGEAAKNGISAPPARWEIFLYSTAAPLPPPARLLPIRCTIFFHPFFGGGIVCFIVQKMWYLLIILMFFNNINYYYL